MKNILLATLAALTMAGAASADTPPEGFVVANLVKMYDLKACSYKRVGGDFIEVYRFHNGRYDNMGYCWDKIYHNRDTWDVKIPTDAVKIIHASGIPHG